MDDGEEGKWTEKEWEEIECWCHAVWHGWALRCVAPGLRSLSGLSRMDDLRPRLGEFGSTRVYRSPSGSSPAP